VLHVKLGAALAALASIILASAAGSLSARPPALLTYSAGEGLVAPKGLCVAGPDGSRGFRLTARKDDRESAWSPAGKYVAFVRYPTRSPGAISEIYLADARGHIVRNLTRTVHGVQAFNGNPAWSPNGRWIAFDSRWRGSAIFLVKRDATDLHRIAALVGFLDPDWTADGRLVFWQEGNWQEGQKESIYTARTDGSDLRRLIPDASQPSVSRDRTRIAFVRSSDIWLADADGGNAMRLIASPEIESRPAWSPDGKRLAFGRKVNDQARTGSVVVADADSGEERAVVRGPGGASAPSWRPAVTLPRASRPACR
jgi:Tol biopolymer transport system component